MPTILFDKMQAARRLETEGKFTREQAETLAAVYHDAMTEAVATKTDLEILESKLSARIADARTQTIVAVIGMIIASGIVQHFWR